MTTTNYYKGQVLPATELNGDFGRCIDRNGDTMSGRFILAGDPVMALDAVTKQYVDNRIVGAPPPSQISVTISDTPPVGAQAGALWWNSTNGQLYVYYTDANSSQWVVAYSVSVGAASNVFPVMDGVAAVGVSALWPPGTALAAGFADFR